MACDFRPPRLAARHAQARPSSSSMPNWPPTCAPYHSLTFLPHLCSSDPPGRGPRGPATTSPRSLRDQVAGLTTAAAKYAELCTNPAHESMNANHPGHPGNPPILHMR